MNKIFIFTNNSEKLKTTLDISNKIYLAKKQSNLQIQFIDIRSNLSKNKTIYTQNNGGIGVCFNSQAIEELVNKFEIKKKKKILIFFSPCGIKFNNKIAKLLSKEKEIYLFDNRFEGVDERAILKYSSMNISFGDYVVGSATVLIPVFIDSISRFINGLNRKDGLENESFENNQKLDFSCFSNPKEWHGLVVPKDSYSGSDKIRKKWREKNSLLRTLIYRKDILINKTFISKLNINDRKNLIDLKLDIEKILYYYKILNDNSKKN